jgi:beta-glucuronidase
MTLLTEYHKVFDYHRNNSVLFGELVWNFSDIMSDQDITRVNANRKGIFTREREPKPSAFLLRNRYTALY